MTLKKITILTTSLLFMFFLNCTQKAAHNNPTITVSILPQKYFLERITGHIFNINVLIPPGHNPATYEPTSRQMKGVSRSILYFRIGHIPFEKAYTASLQSIDPDMKIIDTSQGVSLIYGEHHHTKDEHKQDLHDNSSGIDPHIWLSTKAVKKITTNMLNALCAQFPDKCDDFTQNHKQLLLDISSLDTDIKKILGNTKGKKFIVFHPAWSYFSRDFGLDQISIEFEGKRPNPKHIKKIIDIAKLYNLKTIFVQKQFSTDTAQSIANDIEGNVIQLDPLSEDWLENMKKIALSIKKELK